MMPPMAKHTEVQALSSSSQLGVASTAAPHAMMPPMANHTEVQAL